MSHNLFNERFFSFRETPWHGLGQVSDEPIGAAAAWSRLTPYTITLENLSIPGDVNTVVPYRAITRLETPDDPQKRIFGIVGAEYVLVDPQTICEIFDSAVEQPVETIGALGTGETFFLTTKLPEINVKGDQVESYMVVDSPYEGGEAISVRVTPIRVVCQNTLSAARRQTTELYKIVHDKDAETRLSNWMAGLYQRAVTRSETLAQFFNMLADYSPAAKTVPTIVNKIYPDPKDPREYTNAPEDVIAARLNDYEYFFKLIKRDREAVMELFEGRGTGMSLPQCKGTGWGLYNAVAEWESWRQTTRPMSRLQNLVFGGDRGQKIETAYSTILGYALAKSK